ncbi:MAG: TIGR03620 family F420-dependent LLM class oxidoreductase [Gammaproteobacteria bacterium]
MQPGKLAVWYMTDLLSAPAAAAFAKKVESLGYSALWIPENAGRNSLVASSWLLAETSKLIVATGIARTYAYSAFAMKSGQYALAEQSGGRFLLGIGVSHDGLVQKTFEVPYGKPVATMRAYLDALDRQAYGSTPPPERPPLVLAAIGPRMLELSAERADGAHSYSVTPEHTAFARRILGPSKWLFVEQKVWLGTDAAKARSVARDFVGFIGSAPNYRRNLERFGYSATDFENGCSDRLVDALVAWGDERAIRARIQAHLDAGATQVCISPITAGGFYNAKGPDERVLEVLSPNA